MAYNFTDKLPLELRRETYRLVLQREQAVTLTPRMTKAQPDFDASLFRVNKAISQESLAVFFETNVVHIQPHQISDLINRHGSSIRRLHIEDDSSANGSSLVSKYLEAAATLLNYSKLTPRLKSVTFECKPLHLTVRELVERIAAIEAARNARCFNPEQLRCVEVGTYVLPIPKIAQEWQFSYSSLAHLWEQWRDAQRQYQPSAAESEDYFGIRGAMRIPEWVYEEGPGRSAGMQTHNLRGFAHQVACYGAIEALLPASKSGSAQREILRRFELMAEWRMKKPVLEACVSLAGRINLRDVRKEHGSAILEWATELLAPNTKDFAAAFGQSVKEAKEYLGRNTSW